MKTAIFFVAFAVVIYVALAAPHPPTFPASFSATILSHRTHERHREPEFFRWFYDLVQNRDRIDGFVEFQGEHFFTTHIYDHNAHKEYAIYYQDNAVACELRVLNRTIPKPNFADLHYLGLALIDYQAVNHWLHEDREKHISYQIYDDVTSRRIKRIDFDDKQRHEAFVWTFHELDVSRQDPELFKVPSTIAPYCNVRA
eukprot:TRINITY_DN482_c0_g1_i2.p1 TRINITY_DN482_c0_g1~~TRINITY_DN482_c0_g1_i2.p1  ORF type:complete len:199 (-),score=33.22 TRINITY_DN482_c0_g1_i2:158-754(-)